jgi:2-succinyl-6-hydroxy-2,4-cyclohexadiene-1-carboxylate synthase
VIHIEYEAGTVAVHQFAGVQPPLVALHGFTQTGQSFGELAGMLDCAVWAPDLPGHGATVAHPIDMRSAVAAVRSVLEETGPTALMGYSQGGRIALHTALAHPDHVARLILVSTSLGIRDPAARARRAEADAELASEIESAGIERFLDRWLNQPLFAGLTARSPQWADWDREIRSGNTARGLAAALRGLGQGAQEYLGDRLTVLSMPVLFVAGGNDGRYVEFSKSGAAASGGEVVALKGVGHAVVGEAPQLLAQLISTPSGPGRM